MTFRGSTCFDSKRSGKTFSARIAALFVIALGLVVLPLRPAPRAPGKQLPAVSSSVNNQYGKIPLSFEPNVGQSDAQVQYIARANGYSLFLTPRETVLLRYAASQSRWFSLFTTSISQSTSELLDS